ncbi:MAG: hypothetical protein ACE5KD_02860 [Candidatus Bathyarchaeia archaeon]
MWEDSTKVLAVTVAIFFFTNGLSNIFLPIYLRDLGLSVFEIMVVMFFTFIVTGLLPLALINVTKYFERIISFGILFTLFFYVALIYVKNPIFLGLTYGLGIATFWPSFNLLMFRLSESSERAVMISLLSVTIPSITSIISPAIRGLIIETLDFKKLFLQYQFFCTWLLSLCS